MRFTFIDFMERRLWSSDGTVSGSFTARTKELMESYRKAWLGTSAPWIKPVPAAWIDEYYNHLISLGLDPAFPEGKK